jgi:transcriptional regulator with XRE-family HTH domain
MAWGYMEVTTRFNFMAKIDFYMDSLTYKFGNKLREIRTSRNMTQEELANLAYIDRGHMGHIERGTKSPTLDKIEQISRALKVSPSSLLKDL